MITCSVEHPFPGLRPFKPEDRAFFFGRRREIATLAGLVTRRRFVAVLGASGAGKSSLVKAGLYPRLATELLEKGGQRWHVIELRPRGQPFQELAEAIVAHGQSLTLPYLHGLSHIAAVDRTRAMLRTSADGLTRVIADIGLPAGAAVLVVIDQFEELFRYVGETAFRAARHSIAAPSTTPIDRDEAAAFVANLLAGAASESIPISIIITLRSDFLGECARFLGLPEVIDAGQFLVPRMSRHQLQEAIVEPLRQAEANISPALLQRLLNESGTEPDQLPILQHALMRTWDEARWRMAGPDTVAASVPPATEMAGVPSSLVLCQEHYEAVGTMAHALSNHADAVLAELVEADSELSEVARWLFRALADIDKEGRAVRRPQRLAELVALIGLRRRRKVCRVLERFRAADCSFLVPSQASEPRLHASTVIDIGHEALLRNWRKIRGERPGTGWIEEEFEDGLIWRSLLVQARSFGQNREAVLSPATTEERRKWLTQRPSAYWARRHTVGGQNGVWKQVKALIAVSADSARRAQVRRIFDSIFGTFIAIVLFWLTYDHLYLQERRRTWGELDFLANMGKEDRVRFAENRLDGVAIYLWAKRGEDPSALDRLVQILTAANNRTLFEPDTYEVTEWKAYANIQGMTPTGNEARLITLEHPKKDALTGPMLQTFWQKFSQDVWDNGFPIPWRVSVAEHSDGEAAYRIKVMHLELPRPTEEINRGQGGVPAPSLPTPPYGNEERAKLAEKSDKEIKFEIRPDVKDWELPYDQSQVLLSSMDLDPEAMKLLERYKGEWKAQQTFEELNLSNWWWVPRWTIPIWKAAGHKAFYPPEVSAVVHAVVSIQQQPDLLFSDGFFAGALRSQAKATPHTVTAACEASGGIPALIDQTKTFWIANAYPPLSFLRSFLEDLASKTEQRNPLASDECDLYRVWGRVSEMPETAFFAKEVDAAMTGAFQPESLLRVYVASDLMGYIAPGGPSGPLYEHVNSRVKELQRRITNESGVIVPQVHFILNPDFNDGQFTIAIRGQADTTPFLASPGHELDDILEKLRERLLHISSQLIDIDIEHVAHLTGHLPPALKDWVSKRYSLGKLALILKSMLSRGQQQGQDGATLTHFSWLIRSLHFWEYVCSPSDYSCLGDGLLYTQRARESQPIKSNFLSLPPATFPGIEALVAGRFDDAAAQFSKLASTSDYSSTVMDDFVREYGRFAAQIEYQDACNAEIGRTNSHEYYLEKISDFLNAYGRVLQGPIQRRIEFCKLWRESQQTSEMSDLGEFIDRQFHLGTDEWNINEKYRLASLALKNHVNSDKAKDKAPPPHLDYITTLLTDAIRVLPLEEADSAAEEIYELCAKATAGAWCLQISTSWPRVRPDSFWIPFHLANAWAHRSRDGANRALQLLGQAAGNLSRVGEKRRQELGAWLAFTRGVAHNTLAGQGIEGEREKAIRYFRDVTEIEIQKNGPDIDMVYAALASTLREKGDSNEAWKAIGRGKQYAIHSAMLVEQEAELLWAEGKFDEVLERVKGKPGEWSSYMRALSSLVSNSKNVEEVRADVDEFLSSTHDYRDYVRLIYYWTLMRAGKADDARQLLERRWKEIRQQSWQVRLTPERGDYMAVWREMLIGYYLGKTAQEKFANLLKNPSNFQASEFSKAEYSRRGFLCEWKFYDALFQSMNDDPSSRSSRMLTRLEEALKTNKTDFHEYSLAKNLKTRIAKGEDLTLQSLDSRPEP